MGALLGPLGHEIQRRLERRALGILLPEVGLEAGYLVLQARQLCAVAGSRGRHVDRGCGGCGGGHLLVLRLPLRLPFPPPVVVRFGSNLPLPPVARSPRHGIIRPGRAGYFPRDDGILPRAPPFPRQRLPFGAQFFQFAGPPPPRGGALPGRGRPGRDRATARGGAPDRPGRTPPRRPCGGGGTASASGAAVGLAQLPPEPQFLELREPAPPHVRPPDEHPVRRCIVSPPAPPDVEVPDALDGPVILAPADGRARESDADPIVPGGELHGAEVCDYALEDRGRSRSARHSGFDRHRIVQLEFSLHCGVMDGVVMGCFIGGKVMCVVVGKGVQVSLTNLPTKNGTAKVYRSP